MTTAVMNHFQFVAPAGAMRLELAQGSAERYEKDIIHSGTYTHPQKGWTLDVTPERMDQWVATFYAMKNAGVKVPVTLDHSDSARDVVGEVVDMRRDGDSLIAIHEITKTEGKELATVPAVEISIEIEDPYLGTDGKNYGEAITASSMVQRPVVSGQKPFKKAASLRLSLKEKTMAEETKDEKKDGGPLTAVEALTRLGTKLGLSYGEGSSVEDMLEAVVAKVNEMKAAVETEEEATEKMAMSRALVETASEIVDLKLSSLVEKCSITPAVSKKLGTLIKNQGAKMLSRHANDGKTAMYEEILGILAENKPVSLGPEVKHELSRKTPDAKAPVEPTEADIEDMRKLARGQK
jgi:hypothetical protein